MTKSELLEYALALPHDQQIELAMDLWDAIEFRADDFPLTVAQKAELDRRIAEADANPSEALPWEQVREQILREFHLK